MDDPLLQPLLDPQSPLNIDSLLDAIIALHQDCDHPNIRQSECISKFVNKYAPTIRQIKAHRLKESDFRMIKVIGMGGYGVVRLVRHLKTNAVYAMKIQNKAKMERDTERLYWEERDIMSHVNSDWVVKMHYAFQDAKNLYLVMDYMPGGDLVGFALKYGRPDTSIAEEWVRFYAAEMVEAVAALHAMGYIHRDLKPDNMLRSATGHLKLADFGTCMRMNKFGVIRCGQHTGTIDYSPPETLMTVGEIVAYGVELDWWSIGVVIFEMLFGYSPFKQESESKTHSNIINFRDTFGYPEDDEDYPVSDNAKDLIEKFLTDATVRLGRNQEVDAIRRHPFFENSEWNFENIRSADAPMPPILQSDDDVSYLRDQKNTDPFIDTVGTPQTFKGSELTYIGYTYSHDLGPLEKLRAAVKNQKSVAEMSDDGRWHVHECMASMQKDLEEARRVLAETLISVEKSESDLAEAWKAAQKAVAESKRLSQAEAEGKAALADSEDTRRKLESQLSAQKEASAAVEARLAKAVEDELRAREGMMKAISKLEQANESVRRADVRVEELEKEKSQRKASIHGAEVDESREEVESKHAAALKEIAELAKELAGCRVEEKFMGEEVERLRGERAEMEEQWRNTEAELKAVLQMAEEMKRNLEITVSSNRPQQDMAKELEEKSAEVDSVRADLSKLQDDLRNEQLARRIADAKASDTERIKKMLEKDVEQLEERYQKALKSIEEPQTVYVRPGCNMTSVDENCEPQKKINDLRKQLSLEIALKTAAVNKLEEILAKQLRLDAFDKKSRSINLAELTVEYKKKDRELASLRKDNADMHRTVQKLYDEKEKAVGDLKYSLKKEVDKTCKLMEETQEMRYQIEELSKRAGMLFSKQDENSLDLPSSEWAEDSVSPPPSIPTLEKYLSLRIEIAGKGKKGYNWNRVFGILNQFQMVVLNEMKEYSSPLFTIDAYRIVHVRLVTAADVRSATAENLPKIFHVMYEGEQICSKHPSVSDLSTASSCKEGTELAWKRHDFQELTFHLATQCDLCGKKLSAPIRPPRALECRNCHFKMHKDHVTAAKEPGSTSLIIPVCKHKTGVQEILLQAETEQECQEWVSLLRIVMAASRRNNRRSSTAPITVPQHIIPPL